MEFIPANESKWFTSIFKWYTWLLFYRRFKHVWLRQDYQPNQHSKTVYFLNHNSWWDGLIPLLLNEFRFHQQARALMEDHQMKQYPFFKKIGAFSVNRDDPRKAITSLRYAVQSMRRRHASLFVYPEGKITPPGTDPVFEGGLGWLHSKLVSEDIDFVPVAIHIHTLRHDKPELHLHVGTPVETSTGVNNDKRTEQFEQHLRTMLQNLRAVAGLEDGDFERFI